MIFLYLGNSLTAGYPGYDPSPDGISKGYGNVKSQYEFWLKNLCVEYLEKNLGSVEDKILEELLFINKGIPGELTSNFLFRINQDLLEINPKPDYSIILGGTNDLGWGVSNEEIFNNIKKLHTLSKEADISSIGGTIPPVRMEQSFDSYHNRKIELNKNLVSFFKDKNIPFADLYSGLLDDKGKLKKECAHTDGLHFSVEGYRQMGELIFKDAIKSIIQKKYF
jgi:lysophospholipase L1-like esterase